MMAKSLVRNRHAITKMYQLKSQLQAVSLRMAVRPLFMTSKEIVLNQELRWLHSHSDLSSLRASVRQQAVAWWPGCFFSASAFFSASYCS